MVQKGCGREREGGRRSDAGGGAAGRRERKRTCTARMHRLAQLITCCCSHYTMQLQYACCCNVDEMISSDIHLSSFSLLRFPIYSNRSLHVSRPWRIQKLWKRQARCGGKCTPRKIRYHNFHTGVWYVIFQTYIFNSRIFSPWCGMVNAGVHDPKAEKTVDFAVLKYIYSFTSFKKCKARSAILLYNRVGACIGRWRRKLRNLLIFIWNLCHYWENRVGTEL